MKKNIIITGKPKSGKSTLLRELIKDKKDKVGFITNEILEKDIRVGFEIETHDGNKATLSHINFETPHKVSKYFVNIETLEKIIPKVSDFKNDQLLYLDEIGQMQLFSDKFKELTLQYLDSQNTCIATLSYIYEDEFTKKLKSRDDVTIIEISPESRGGKKQFIEQLL